MDEIGKEEALIHAFRQNPGKLVFELYPFAQYLVWAYPQNDVLCNIVIGNQGYDGKVYREGKTIEWVEVCRPAEGKRDFIRGRELNDLGFSSIEVYEMIDRQNEIIETVMQTAKKKAMKDYNDFTLIISVSAWNEIMYFNHRSPDGLEGIDRLVGELGKISFKANHVFLILDPYSGIETRIIQI